MQNVAVQWLYFNKTCTRTCTYVHNLAKNQIVYEVMKQPLLQCVPPCTCYITCTCTVVTLHSCTTYMYVRVYIVQQSSVLTEHYQGHGLWCPFIFDRPQSPFQKSLKKKEKHWPWIFWCPIAPFSVSYCAVRNWEWALEKIVLKIIKFKAWYLHVQCKCRFAGNYYVHMYTCLTQSWHVHVHASSMAMYNTIHVHTVFCVHTMHFVL